MTRLMIVCPRGHAEGTAVMRIERVSGRLGRTVVRAVSALCLVGGIALMSAPVGAVTAQTSGPFQPAGGYRLVAGDGGVFNYGDSAFYGAAASDAANCPTDPPGRSMPGGSCWSIAPTPDDQGYWIVNAYSGRVFPFGDAVSYGQPADSAAYAGSTETWPTSVSIVSTPSGKGYWIVDSDGGVFSFGDAPFQGSMGGQHLNAPVVAMVPTPDSAGYWLAAADGGVFTFGDATFGGSMGGVELNAPVVGIARNPVGAGYWLAAADGGVFALGGAEFLGSMGGTHLNKPVFGIAGSPALI